jgi:hypothetical protein
MQIRSLRFEAATTLPFTAFVRWLLTNTFHATLSGQEANMAALVSFSTTDAFIQV